MELFRNPRIDFMKWKRVWVGISLTLVTLSLVLVFTKGINQSVEFTGGAEVILRYVEAPRLDEVRARLEQAGIPSVSVTEFGDTKGLEIGIRAGLGSRKAGEQGNRRDLAQTIVAALEPAELRERQARGQLDLNIADAVTIEQRLLAAGLTADQARSAAEAMSAWRRDNGGVFANVQQAKAVPGLPAEAQAFLDQQAFTGPFGLRAQNLIEASVSGEMRRKALWATLGAIGGMLAYIWFRFRFQWGVGAIVALVHDVIVALGAFVLAGYQADLPVVAAFLTLIGYSVNDTIVIYDRIRENINAHGEGNLDRTINDSINQTLSRTVITSLCTWFSVFALWMFGGPVLEPFSFVLLIGLIAGSYSTIYVASPTLTFWLKLFGGRALGKDDGKPARPAATPAKGAKA